MSPSKKNWISREEMAPNVGHFSIETYPLIVQRFLNARGIVSPEEVDLLFSPKLAQLADPFSIFGMERAVQRLVQAFKDNQSVCIYADFDLDGTSGLALLFDGMKKLGFSRLSHYQPKRLSEGYGFHPHAVEDLAAQGVNVIVTVDVGITAIEAVEKARAVGVNVIITDHHQPAAKLPDAYVIVNPNQHADTSQLGYLCGAGVAFYLLRALNRVLVKEKLAQENQLDFKLLLDFFTIGTLTDLVPLVHDNRVLVKHGLLQLELTQRPGLRALLMSLNMEDRKLSSQDVAIRFAPKLNALSRMENGILPIDLFIVENIETAEKMVKQVLSNNEDRVSLQQSGEKQASELLLDWPHGDFIFVSSKSFHRGVIGLIATKLAQAYNRPAFVGSENEEGLVVGSARIPAKGEPSLLAALESVGSVLNRFGGHHSAAGFEFHASQTKQIIELLQIHFEKVQSNPQPVAYHYDLELGAFDLTPNLLKWLDALGPFGQGFPVPMFVLRNHILKAAKTLRGGHIKFTLNAELGRTENVEALYFSPPSDFECPTSGERIDILGEVQWNYFAGSKTVQFLVRDICKSHDGVGAKGLS